MSGLITFRSSSSRKPKPQLELEAKIRTVIGGLTEQGFVVRRENLARGHSYRVKSGGCVFVNNRVLFVDKRLPPAQQLSVLREFAEGVTSASE